MSGAIRITWSHVQVEWNGQAGCFKVRQVE